MVQAKGLFNGCRRAIPTANPDHFGWMAEEEAPLMKVCILGDDGQALLDGVLPHSLVAGLGQSHVSDVL